MVCSSTLGSASRGMETQVKAVTAPLRGLSLATRCSVAGVAYLAQWCLYSTCYWQGWWRQWTIVEGSQYLHSRSCEYCSTNLSSLHSIHLGGCHFQWLKYAAEAPGSFQFLRHILHRGCFPWRRSHWSAFTSSVHQVLLLQSAEGCSSCAYFRANYCRPPTAPLDLLHASSCQEASSFEMLGSHCW